MPAANKALPVKYNKSRRLTVTDHSEPEAVMRRGVVRLLCATVVLSVPRVLAAQQDTARRADSAKHVTITPIIVTASRDPMPQNRLGVATSVLTRADLLHEPAPTAGDALSRMPGVFMDATVGPDGPSNIRLRGGDETFTKVMMDGVEVNF